MLTLNWKRPKDVVEPSENGTRLEVREAIAIGIVLRWLDIGVEPSDCDYLIVLMNDERDIVEVYAVVEGPDEAWPIFPTDKTYRETT